MNTFKKILPVILLVVVAGVAGYSIGQVKGKSQALDNTQASLYNATTEVLSDWWPAGSGFCYHKVRNEWASHWVLGEISKGRCIDIKPKVRMDTLDTLIKEGAFQSQEKLK